MNRKPVTNRDFLAATAVFVALFCFFPNFLTGLLAFGIICGWLVHDVHGFLQAAWRIILALFILAGVCWTALWLTSPPSASMGALHAPGGISIGLVVIAGAVFFLIRSVRNAKKDWTA
jgi:hypothetical protein